MKAKGKAGYFFRIFFVPAMFLYAMIEFHWVRCCALGVMAAWFSYWTMESVRRDDEERKKALSEEEEEKAAGTEEFLLRQLTRRVTERLAETFPGVEWQWLHTPLGEELHSGGTWCIHIFGAEPYDYGLVYLDESGELSVETLHAVPQEEHEENAIFMEEEDRTAQAETMKEEETPTAQETSAQAWYAGGGEETLAAWIDELNAQGCHQLSIHADGRLTTWRNGQEDHVATLDSFLPREDWPDLSALLEADGIHVVERPDRLVMNW